MITYKGDRFVKGKTFLHESSKLRFITKSKKGFVFENVTDNSLDKGKTVILDEAVAKNLSEVHKCQKAV